MASHRRGCWRSCGDSAAPSHTQGGGATAAFIDSSTVGDDEGKPGERKLKKERISKECGFASLAETDFPFLLDELLRASVNGTIVPGDRWSPTSQLSSSPIPSQGAAPLPLSALMQQAGRKLEKREAGTVILHAGRSGTQTPAPRPANPQTPTQAVKKEGYTAITPPPYSLH